MKRVVTLGLLLLCVLCIHAQVNVVSRASGNWHQPTTWEGNRVPGDNDIVIVQTGHELVVSKDISLRNLTLRIVGTLRLTEGKSIALNTSSVVNIISGGKLLADIPGQVSAVLIGNEAKFRGTKIFNPAWGQGVLYGLAYATSTTGNVDQSGSGFIIGNLPAIWQDLKLYVTPEKLVQMVWVTSHETGTRSFRIERSAVNQGWKEIGAIESSGNMAAQNIYNFVDNSPGSGTVFYRVREIDPNGISKFSSVRSVRLEEAWVENKLFPNPADHQVELTYPKIVSKASLRVFNINGQLVLTQALAPGSVNQVLDISSWPNGVYAIQVLQADGITSQHRLVKF